MAQRFNRAMELMGWRVPSEESPEEEMPEYQESEVDVHEFTLQSYPGGQIEVEPRPVRAATVRRIVTFHPQSFEDAPLIGDAFREGVPVIMNLTELPHAEARRLVDFAAGMVFSVRGEFEHVTSRVFLLVPKDIEVSSQGRSAPGRMFD